MSKRPYIYYSEMNSPIGILTIGSSSLGICFIYFGSIKRTCSNIETWLKKRFVNAELVEDGEKLATAIQQLDEYFKGERTDFDLPLDLIGTKFQTLVWNKVKDVAYGTTKSYKQIAAEIGSPKAVRAIGGANNQNPIPIIIPCHRVIGSNGSMVGYGGGLDKKEFLLRHEGAIQKIS
ncbi:methylated-DNA--[protein]-cysteine S-methyltransferase [Evansella cellulosilytica]|uniref:Methylated-DNA--protein-cysteine methyltransferase n=1 Tax=Evansella cellulosilytica (strain ATCC 21833 / DSM 2522 / FERM P-1141 / JCM 9156 / N-4) TaxID=649639 RepID=E6TTI4_EVAC2|nr:methylated-DNA--[protein]-cysteine S-methyltransferase [Evansella cellulosilytica]ADU29620.1 methylated-DNA/protein-cysteine methyltransferase [Evansella cellulosilytica DSM 2522]